MEVFELKLKVYICRVIQVENSLTCISELIDKSFLKSDLLTKLHKDNVFKNYTFNSLYPIENSKNYAAGKVYTVTIRTIDERLAEHFTKVLVNEYTESLKALTIETKIIPRKHIDKIYSVTPAVAKFSKGYWRTNETIDTFERRLRENLIKKYNAQHGTKLSEDFELFTFLKFINKKPVATSYKNIKILGDKIELSIADNSTAQELAYLALGCGVLEMNSRGMGYVNFKWL